VVVDPHANRPSNTGSVPYWAINLANRKVPMTMAALKRVMGEKLGSGR